MADDGIALPVAGPPRGLAKAGVGAAVAAVLVVAGGLVARHDDAGIARRTSAQDAVPTVRLIAPMRGAAAQTLVLPATLEAWNTAHIFARVSGYVRGWNHDIGDHVAAGAPLGTIDTPELDQQIVQARAALARVTAEAGLARTTAARWQDLLTTASVSRQEADEKNADATTHAAAVREAQADLGRLLAMKAYATIRAPFSGEVTLRNADIGDLVGPGVASQQPMFAMADEQRIRVYVEVPQQYAAALHPGMTASLTVPDRPGAAIPARILAVSGAIDSRSGAFQVQLVTANPGGLLKSGGYAQVRFALPDAGAAMTVPAGALMLRAGGTSVATVDAHGRIRLLKVSLGRDFGNAVEIVAGLPPGVRIIDNPPDSIATGEQVHVEG